ncbi:MAG: hypothetical protein OXU50_02690, partial [Gammaproteobacteria bacterium]|nr:hypothetical protein [Gammaproteobacteria bacterium]
MSTNDRRVTFTIVSIDTGTGNLAAVPVYANNFSAASFTVYVDGASVTPTNFGMEQQSGVTDLVSGLNADIISASVTIAASADQPTSVSFSSSVRHMGTASGRMQTNNNGHGSQRTVTFAARQAPPMPPPEPVAMLTAVGAGADQSNVLEDTTVTLMGRITGSGSLSYTWAQVNGGGADATPVSPGITITGASGTLTGSGDAVATFTAPEQASHLQHGPQLAATDYYFRLTGTGGSMSISDTVVIRVIDAAPPSVTVTPANQRVADGETAALAGVGTLAGIGITGRWTHIDGSNLATAQPVAGPGAIATSPANSGVGTVNSLDTPALPEVAAGTEQNFYFRFDATRSDNSSATSALATVTAFDNEGTPTASAGADQVVSTDATVTLNATGSADATGATGVGANLTYAWTQITSLSDDTEVSGAGAVTLSDAAAAEPTFTAPSSAATLYFRLVASDTITGNTDDARTTVTVQAATTPPPPFVAGAPTLVVGAYAPNLSNDEQARVQVVANDNVITRIHNRDFLETTIPCPADSCYTVTFPAVTGTVATNEFEFPRDFVYLTLADSTNAGGNTTGLRYSLRGVMSPTDRRDQAHEGVARPTTSVHSPGNLRSSNNYHYWNVLTQTVSDATGLPANVNQPGVTVEFFRRPETETANSIRYWDFPGTRRHFELQVVAGEEAQASTQTAIVTVEFVNPPLRTFGISGPAAVNEGEDMVITITVTHAEGVVPQDVTALWQIRTRGANPVSRQDFVGLTGSLSGTLSIPAAATSASATVPVVSGDADNVAETYAIVLRNPSIRVGSALDPIRVEGQINAGAAVSAPTVSAGTDQENVLEGGTVTLAGTVNGAGTLSYTWEQVASAANDAAVVSSGPDYVGALTGATGTPGAAGVSTATFTAPMLAPADNHGTELADNEYYFRLSGAAEAGGMSSTATDIVTIEVIDGSPPVVYAITTDQSVVEGASVDLQGRILLNGPGITLRGRWVQVDGPGTDAAVTSPARFTFLGERDLGAGRSAPYTLDSMITAPNQGNGLRTTYYLRLDGVRADNSTRTSIVATVTVSDDDGSPTANAGADQTVNTGAGVRLDATGSRDAAGNTVNLAYAWSQVSADDGNNNPLPPGDPGLVTLSNPATAITTFTAPSAASVLFFRVVVTDTITGNTNDAVVTIAVEEAAVQPAVAPTVSVGADMRVNEEATGLVLTGSVQRDAADNPASTLSFEWVQVDSAAADAAEIATGAARRVTATAIATAPDAAGVASATFTAPRAMDRRGNGVRVVATDEYFFRLIGRSTVPGQPAEASSATLKVTVFPPRGVYVSGSGFPGEVIVGSPNPGVRIIEQNREFTVTIYRRDGVDPVTGQITIGAGIGGSTVENTGVAPTAGTVPAHPRPDFRFKDISTQPGQTKAITGGGNTVDFAYRLLEDSIPEDEEGVGFGYSINAGCNECVIEYQEGFIQNAAIQDDDTITVGWQQTAVTANEADGVVTLTAVITSPAAGQPIERSDFNLSYATADGTASSAANADFTAISATEFTLGAGTRSVQIPVTLTNDENIELGAGETFTVRISTMTDTPALTAIGADTVTVTIQDDDFPAPEVSIAPNRASFNEGDTDAQFTVTLTGGPFATAVPVNFAVTGTGITTGDYDITAPTGIGAADSQGTLMLMTHATDTAGNPVNGTVTLTITDDDLFEAAETLVLEARTADSAVSSTSVTIAASDRDITLQLVDALAGGNPFPQTATDVAEGATVDVCVAIVDPAPGFPIGAAQARVTLATGTGSPTNAAVAADFMIPSATLTLDNANRVRCHSIQAVQDAIPEPDQQFFVALNAPQAADLTNIDSATTSGSDTVALNIRDDDGITVAWSASAVTVGEGAASAMLTAEITSPAAGTAIERGDFNLAYATVDGTATGGDDYTTISAGAITLGHSARSANASIQVTQDTLNEANETFTVNLTEAVDGVSLGTTNMATVTITDDDPRTVSIGVNPTSAAENSTATFTVTMDGMSAGPVTVPLTIGGSAMGADYTLPAGNREVVIAAGATEQTYSVGIVNDTLNEAAQTVVATLGTITAGTGAGTVNAGSPNSATVQIMENDPVTLSIARVGDEMVQEGSNARFRVTMNGAAAGAEGVIEAGYTVLGGSATDYTDNGGGTVSLAAGMTQAVIELAIRSDGEAEAAETLTVRLDSITQRGAGAGAATIGSPNSADITIPQNSASAYSFAYSPAAATEIAEGASATYTLAVSGPDLGANSVVMAWAVTATAATGDVDITADDFPGGMLPGGTLTFTASETSQTFVVTLADDTVSEPQEAFSIAYSITTDAPGTSATPDPQTVTIPANDTARVQAMVSGTATVMEDGDPVIIVVDIADGIRPTAPIEVSWTARDNETGSGNNNARFRRWLADPEDYIVTGTGVTSMLHAINAGGPRELSSFGIGPSNAPDGKRGTIALNEANNYRAEVLFDPVDDNILERRSNNSQNEQIFRFHLASARNTAGGGGASGVSDASSAVTVTIQDNDRITVSMERIRDAVEGAGSTAVARIVFNGGVFQPHYRLQIRYTIGGCQALTRCTVDSGTQSSILGGAGLNQRFVRTLDLIPRGNYSLRPNGVIVTSVEVFLTADSNELNEAERDIRIEWTAAASDFAGSVVGASPITLKRVDDDDITIAISADPPLVREGESVTFTAELAGAASGSVADIGVPFTIGGNAVAADYNQNPAVSSPITIPAGSTSAEIRFDILNDMNAGETSETLTVTLGTLTTDAAGGRVEVSADRGSATAVIAAAAHILTLELVSAATVAEGNGGGTTNVNFRVRHEGDAYTSNTPVNWQVTHGATTAADIMTTNGTVTFGTGDGDGSMKTFSVPVSADDLNEPDETFSVAISIASVTADGGTRIGGSPQTVTINDDDDALVSLGSGAAVPEAAGTTVFTVNMDHESQGQVVVALNVSGSAAIPADITVPAQRQVVFAPGDRTANFSIGVVDDTLNEAQENIIVTLGAITPESGVAGMVSAGTPNSETRNINDNDAVTVNIAAVREDVNEGSDAEFTISLSGQSADAITVMYGISGDDITASDYTDAGMGRITVPANTAMETLRIAILSDATPEATETMIVTLNTADGGANAGSVSIGSAARSRTGGGDQGGSQGGTGGGNRAAAGQNDRARVIIAQSSSATRTLSLSGPASLNEGDMGTYTITLNGSAFTANTDVTWVVESAGESGADTADFAGNTTPTATIQFSSTEGDGTAKQFMVGTADDNLNESTQTFTVRLSVADPRTDGGTGFSGPQQTAITDNDPLTVAVADAGTVNEGETASFAVTLTGGVPSERVRLRYTLAATGVGGFDDWDPVSLLLDIAADTTQGAIAVPIRNENINESTETLTLTLGTPQTAGAISGAGDTATATIPQNDDIRLGLSCIGAAISVMEGQQTAGCNLLEGSGNSRQGPITIEWMAAVVTQTNLDTRAGSTTRANANSDGERDLNARDLTSQENSGNGAIAISARAAGIITGTLTTPPTDAVSGNFGSFSVSAVQDGREESTETFIVSLTRITDQYQGSGSIIVESGRDSATYEIPANLAAQRFVAFGAATANGEEGNVIDIPVELTGIALESNVTVPVTVAAGSGANPAEAGDYTLMTTQLTFTGTGTQNVRLRIEDDNLNESAETVAVMLGTAEGGGGTGALVQAPSSVEVTIAQSDPITYSITGPATADEGAEAAFTLSLSAAAEGTVSVALDTVSGALSGGLRALDSAEHGGVPASVTVAAGASSTEFRVNLVDDSLVEVAEGFQIAPGNITGSAQTGMVSAAAGGAPVVRITDNDDAYYTITAPESTVAEGGDARFNINLVRQSDDGRVTAPGDIVVPWSAQVGAQGNTGDANTPAVPDITGGTGAAAAASASGEATIMAGQSTATITLSINSDQLAEDEETLTVTLGASATLTPETGVVARSPASGDAQVTIPENTAASQILSVARISGSGPLQESGAGADLYRMTLDIPSGGTATDAITVNWRFSTATVGANANPAETADFTASSGSVTFDAGAAAGTSATVSLQVVNDRLNEGDEAFSLLWELAQANTDVALPPRLDGTIAIDTADTIILSRTLTTLQCHEGTSCAPFTYRDYTGTEATEDVSLVFTLDATGSVDGANAWQAGEGGITVTVEQTANVATLTMSAFNYNINVQRFAARFDPRQDSFNEDTQTVVIRVTGGESAGAVSVANIATASIIVRDDDPTTVSVGDAPAANEGDSARFPVEFIGGIPTRDVEIDWEVVHGTTVDADFVSLTGTERIRIAFPTGLADAVTTGIVRVAIARDDDDEEDTFTLRLTGARGAGGSISVAAATSGTAVINRLDLAAPRFADPDEQPGWTGGQQVLWVKMNENIKVLASPSGATASTDAASLTTLNAGDFTVTENCCAPAMSAAAGIAVSAVAAFPDETNPALRLTLARAITGGAANVMVDYAHSGGNAIYDTALERGLAGPGGRNMTTGTSVLLPVLAANLTADADGDGIPDAVEARISGDAGNPFVAVTDAQQPVLDIRRTASRNPVAYSGIREHGVRAHLGVLSIPALSTQTAAQTITAYYRSDTFGYDGTYQCAGSSPFPSNYDAPLSEGGCAAVDWGDIAPSTNHTIAWLARSADGVWAVRTNTDSNLPEQVIWRIPELNMDAQSRFTTGMLVIRASLDSEPSEALLLLLSRTPVGSTASEAVMASGGRMFATATRTSAESAVWEITGLVADSGALTPHLYRPAARPTTATASFIGNVPLADEYSLGLVPRTQVTRINAPVP